MVTAYRNAPNTTQGVKTAGLLPWRGDYGVMAGVMHRLETERLRLRPYETTDLDLLAPLYADPSVTALTKLGRRTRAQAQAILDDYVALWHTRGLGMRALFRKSDAAFVGECGLFLSSRGGVSLRYGLGTPHWGCGYTTEAAAATLADAFERIAVDHVWSIAQEANTASHRVMEKLGMTIAERDRDGDIALRIYKITAEGWRAASESGAA